MIEHNRGISYWAPIYALFIIGAVAGVPLLVATVAAALR